MEKFQSLYVESSSASRMRLYEKSLSICLSVEKGARGHVNEFANTCELRTVGVNIEDNLYKLALI